MRTRGPGGGHQEAVSQRLALLSEQLSAARSPAPPAPSLAGADEDESGLAKAPAAGGEWWQTYTRVAPPARPPAPLRLVPDGPPEVPPGRPATSVPAAPPGPTPVPAPGRHAGRHAGRRPGALVAAVPETLRGRAWFGPGPLAVVALLVAVGLAITCWWLVRGDPEPTVFSGPGVSSSGSPADDDLITGADPGGTAVQDGEGVPGAPGATDPAIEVIVDVAGRVRRPGIVVLDEGARVVDALRKAGGARPGVDLSALNLARVLVDGEQIVVGRVATAPGVPPAGPAPGGDPPPSTPTTPAAPVNLNLATQAELEALPDVGPVTAAAIIAWREENGAFSAVTELLEVDGIGDVTLAKLTPLVTV